MGRPTDAIGNVLRCKTGLTESSQIDTLLDLFQRAPGAAFRFKPI